MFRRSRQRCGKNIVKLKVGRSNCLRRSRQSRQLHEKPALIENHASYVPAFRCFSRASHLSHKMFSGASFLRVRLVPDCTCYIFLLRLVSVTYFPALAIIHLAYPPTFCITIVSNLSWVFTVVPRDIEDNAYAIFFFGGGGGGGRLNEVHCGQCKNGE